MSEQLKGCLLKISYATKAIANEFIEVDEGKFTKHIAELCECGFFHIVKYKNSKKRNKTRNKRSVTKRKENNERLGKA